MKVSPLLTIYMAIGGGGPSWRRWGLADKPMERALKVSGEKTKKAAVSRALEEFITRRSQKRLVDLMAKLEWDESFNYKAERSRR